MTLGVVTGLKAEARIVRRHLGGRTIVIATGTGASARDAAERLAEGGATALLSFGIAGGLDPRLAPGSLVIADTIVLPPDVFTTDESWRRRAAARLQETMTVEIGAIAGCDAPVATPAEKASLRASSGAVAADMESHLIAAVAARRGLAFLAIRAIADPAMRAVPRSAAAAASSDGAIRIGAFVAGLLSRPGDLAALWSLAGDYRAAMRALGRAAAESPAAFAVR